MCEQKKKEKEREKPLNNIFNTDIFTQDSNLQAETQITKRKKKKKKNEKKQKWQKPPLH